MAFTLKSALESPEVSGRLECAVRLVGAIGAHVYDEPGVLASEALDGLEQCKQAVVSPELRGSELDRFLESFGDEQIVQLERGFTLLEQEVRDLPSVRSPA